MATPAGPAASLAGQAVGLTARRSVWRSGDQPACWSGDQIVHLHDIWRSRVNPGLLQDRHEYRPVGLEGLLGLPHLVDHEIIVRPEAGVVNPAGRVRGSGGLEFGDGRVVPLRAQGLGMEVDSDCHGSSWWGSHAGPGAASDARTGRNQNGTSVASSPAPG